MLYIFLRNAGSGGARKYARVLLKYLHQNQIEYIAEVHPKDDDLYTPYNTISFPSRNLGRRLVRRRYFLRSNLINKAFIPYQVLPLNFWFACENTIMIRNMEPFLHWNFSYDFRGRARNVLIYFLTQISIAITNKIICVGQHVQDTLDLGKNLKKSVVIPHGVDTIESAVPEKQEHLAVVVGSGLPYRGLEDVLSIPKSHTSCHDFRFQWFGNFLDTTYEKKIESLERNTSVHLTKAGHQPRTEVLNAMHLCKVYIATSRIEACPNTALEAMSAGAHIIATDTASHREFLPSTTRFYQPGNSEELAAHLDQLNHALPPADYALRSWSETMEKTLDFILHGLH